MKQRVFRTSLLLLATAVIGVGCAEILGLEPPSEGSGTTTTTGGTGGATSSTTTSGGAAMGGTTGGTTTTGGTAGSGGCNGDGDCPPDPMAPCKLPICENNTCLVTDVADGTSIPCYTGAPGTLNVGDCKVGHWTCKDGQPDSKCMGEVVPQIENCQSAQDEACDGPKNECPGQVLEAVQIPGMLTNDLTAVAVDADGSVFIAGRFTQSVTVAGCVLTANAEASFIAKLDSVFACQWAVRLEDTASTTRITDLALGNGLLWAIGEYSGTATLTSPTNVNVGTYASQGSTDVLTLSLAPGSGQLNTAFRIGGSDAQTAAAIAVGGTLVYSLVSSKGITVVTEADGSNPQSVPGLGGSDVVLVAETLGGKMDSGSVYGSVTDDFAGAIGVDGSSLYIGGRVGPASNMPTTPLCLSHDDALGRAFVISPQLGQPTCRTFLATSTSRVNGIWPHGDVVTSAGTANGAIALGCGVNVGTSGANGWLQTSKASLVGCDAAVVELGNSDVVIKALGGIAADPIVGGHFLGQIYGTPGQAQDVFLARYPGGSGPPGWSLVLGGTLDDFLADVTVSPVDGSVFAVGLCSGMSFADKFDCDDVGDGYLVKISP